VTPKTLGDQRYQVEGRLGHGGMATVLLAHDRKLDREVAIKLLADNLAGDEDVRVRFTREARLAAKLDHPNVVRVFDVGEEDDRPYIVMELVAGGTLADRLERRRRALPLSEALPLLRQMGDGLGHAHAKRLVHRDVKPQNLLLRSADGCLKIADFGIARAAEETRLTRTGRVIGTDRYMAPEQLSDGRISPATDVYACGVVAYEMLPKRRPPELTEIVQRCLQANPRDRFADGRELREALAAVDENGIAPARVPVASLPTQPRTAVRTRPATAPTSRLTRAEQRGGEPGTRRRYPEFRRGAALMAAVLVGLVLVVGIVIAISSGGSETPSAGDANGGAQLAPRNEPVPQLDDPADQARALADWFRAQGR
jgi:eukaryotic-like serine/threonine-protein kinase